MIRIPPMGNLTSVTACSAVLRTLEHGVGVQGAPRIDDDRSTTNIEVLVCVNGPSAVSQFKVRGVGIKSVLVDINGNKESVGAEMDRHGIIEEKIPGNLDRRCCGRRATESDTTLDEIVGVE